VKHFLQRSKSRRIELLSLSGLKLLASLTKKNCYLGLGSLSFILDRSAGAQSGFLLAELDLKIILAVAARGSET
jgi:hypothetical protein